MSEPTPRALAEREALGEPPLGEEIMRLRHGALDDAALEVILDTVERYASGPVSLVGGGDWTVVYVRPPD